MKQNFLAMMKHSMMAVFTMVAMECLISTNTL